MSLIRMSLQKLLPLLQHQKVQKPPMVLLHLLFHIGVEKLLCLLQSPQTLLSLNHEGFACSHLGVSSIWLFCFHATGDTPSLLLHTTPYAITAFPFLIVIRASLQPKVMNAADTAAATAIYLWLA